MAFFNPTKRHDHGTPLHEGYPDFCSDAGASILAQKIKDFWLARGYDVRVKLEHQEFHPAVRSARSDVRSNLVNGMPPNFHRAIK